MNIPVITPLGIIGCVLLGLGLLFLLANLKIIAFKATFINALLSLLFVFAGGILWWVELTQIQPLEPFAFPIWAAANSDRLVYNDIPVVTLLGIAGWVLLTLGIGLALLLLKKQITKSVSARLPVSLLFLLIGGLCLFSELALIQPLPSVALAAADFTGSSDQEPFTLEERTIIPEQAEIIAATQPKPLDLVQKIPGIYLITGLPEEKPTPTPTPQGRTFQDMQDIHGERVVLDERRHMNGYEWFNGSPNVTKQTVSSGNDAFTSSGNHYFTEDLGRVGYEIDEIRYLNLRLFLTDIDAALLLQLRFDAEWRRWGFDGRTSYQGEYDSNEKTGVTTQMPTGEWVDVRLDLIDDLKVRPGQRLLGLSFSGSDGNLVYDGITLERSEPITGARKGTGSWDELQKIVEYTEISSIGSQKENIILSEYRNNKYNWIGGEPYITTQIVYDGRIAFIPTGDHTIEEELGTIGNGPDEIAYITFKAFLLSDEAHLLLRANLNERWGYQWGFDGRSAYQDIYPGETKGERINMPTGRWLDVRIDLVEDLEAKPGDELNGLAFFSQDGYMIIDRVSLQSLDPAEIRRDEIETARQSRP